MRRARWFSDVPAYTSYKERDPMQRIDEHEITSTFGSPHARRCGAKTRCGAPCRNLAVRARTRCRMHGGSTPRGFASPHTKTGGRSLDLPTRLAATYESALNDRDLLELTTEIALSDARYRDLLKRVDSGEAGVLWRAARKAFRDFQTAGGDQGKMINALNTLESLLTQGVSDYAAWDEAGKWADRKARLVESQRKREESITPAQMLLAIGLISHAIRKHVTDADTLRDIQDEINQLTVSSDSVN